jgi:5,10-methylenetetrahydromethanopterin reductase
MPLPRFAVQQAVDAEASGWDGIVYPDSQNFAADCYIIMAEAANATSKLGIGAGVTNTFTRHPAVIASAAATLQAISGGRVVLGIGRGDSALANLGLAPVGLVRFEQDVAAIHAFLAGEDVKFEDLGPIPDGMKPASTLGLGQVPEGSRLEWVRPNQAPVPLAVAASGPKVIGIAARTADAVWLNVGSDPHRTEWGVRTTIETAAEAGRKESPRVGAFVNVVCHPDKQLARELVSSMLTVSARFAVMHGNVEGPASAEAESVLRKMRSEYDMTQHSKMGSRQAGALTAEFIDDYAIAGPVDHCVQRLRALRDQGIDHFVVFTQSVTAERMYPVETSRAAAYLAHEVLPAVREG